VKKIFLSGIGRRQFLKASLSGLALATLPRISFAQSNPDVVVIGAGSAGLSATAELMKRGISVLCIEGMNRIGGRCYTDNSTFGVPADHGAHWLHAKKGNELYKFGRENKDKFKIYNEPSTSVVYDGKKKFEFQSSGHFKEAKEIGYKVGKELLKKAGPDFTTQGK